MIDFERLFNPRAIGIIGANEKRFGGGYFLQSLKRLGFERPVYLFNPRLKGRSIEGHIIYGSILDIPDDEAIDYVIISVPAKHCPSVLEECGKREIPFVTLFSSGFSEVGKVELENQVLEIAKKYNIRIIGPNCLGVYVPKIKLTFSLSLLSEKSGNLGLICQSGGLAIYLASMGQSVYGINPSKVLSIGNQIDLNFVDFLEYFLTDDETNIIGLYIENIKSQKVGERFLKVARELAIANKPVILWKVGSGEATKEAIISHTGGLAGKKEIWDSLAKQTGMCLVKNSHELINLAMAFQHISQLPINRNMGLVTQGGGASIEATDVFEQYNLKVPKITPETADKYRELLPDVNTIIRNPLDLGSAGADPEIFSKTVLYLDSDPNISAVVFLKSYDFNYQFLQSIKKAYKVMKNPLICVAYKVVDDTSDYSQKLLFKKELFKLKVPVFESIDLAAKTLDKMCTFREFLDVKDKYKKDLIYKAISGFE
jgi:acetyltransferase